MWPSTPLLDHWGSLLIRHCQMQRACGGENEISCSEAEAASDCPSTSHSCVPHIHVIWHPLWQAKDCQSLAVNHHLFKGSSCNPRVLASQGCTPTRTDKQAEPLLLCTGVQEAMAEILALQDFLYDVISIYSGSIDSLQLILHWALFHRMSWNFRRGWEVIRCMMIGCGDGGSDPALPLMIAALHDAADACGGRTSRRAPPMAEIC